jgi:hypothetical protein
VPTSVKALRSILTLAGAGAAADGDAAAASGSETRDIAWSDCEAAGAALPACPQPAVAVNPNAKIALTTRSMVSPALPITRRTGAPMLRPRTLTRSAAANLSQTRRDRYRAMA